MIRLCHIITGLGTGGAEMMLYKLLSGMDRKSFEAQVVSLTDIGPMGRKIQELEIPVRALGMTRGLPNPMAVFRLAYWLKQDSPDIIQTWMYHADLVGGLAGKLAGSILVVWNIRNGNFDYKTTKKSTIWTAKACASLSFWLPERIVCCSEVSRKIHTEFGYLANKFVVIPNGFNLEFFKPDPIARLSVRQELGITEGVLLIGLIGRFDPQKDHRNFIQAAGLLHTRLPEIHFLLCGDGANWENQKLSQWIEVAGIHDYCHLLDKREDISRLTAALDIATSSSSYGEAFSNVIGEAMACGVPCVVTNVGDSSLIVGDTGRIVPPKKPEDLASAWYELIKVGPEKRCQLGIAARQRVQECFSLPGIIERYEELYKELAYVRYNGFS